MWNFLPCHADHAERMPRSGLAVPVSLLLLQLLALSFVDAHSTTAQVCTDGSNDINSVASSVHGADSSGK